MSLPPPSFAHDAGTAAYYDQRASEYDEWYEGEGQFATSTRPGWLEEVDRVIDALRALSWPRRSSELHCWPGLGS